MNKGESGVTTVWLAWEIYDGKVLLVTWHVVCTHEQYHHFLMERNSRPVKWAIIDNNRAISLAISCTKQALCPDLAVSFDAVLQQSSLVAAAVVQQL